MSQMYPKTQGWNPMRGLCEHGCLYCYNPDMCRTFPALQSKYLGDPRLDVRGMKENLYAPKYKDKTIFVCSMLDLFASDVPSDVISAILRRCCDYPNNTYLLQSKNIGRIEDFLWELPSSSIIGTTIETDNEAYIRNWSSAPAIEERVLGMERVNKEMPVGKYSTMISIEPVMDFDLDFLLRAIERIYPSYVSIGADSKDHGVPEPSGKKVLKLIKHLEKFTRVKVKPNLQRIIGRTVA